MAGSTAETLEDCTLCVMSRSAVEHLIASKPSVALNIVHLLATRNAEHEERLERQAFQSVHERLAAILLRLAGDGLEIKDVSHQQIGESIGASRETVTLALGDFRWGMDLHLTVSDALRSLRTALHDLHRCRWNRPGRLFGLGREGKA
jgi:CRP-like cAMP-binding protein